MKHLLDQPVWNALITGNHNLANGSLTAKYLDKAVGPFADVEDQHYADFKTLYHTMPNNSEIAVFSIKPDLEAGPWSLIKRLSGLQMIYDKPVQELSGRQPFRPLGNKDIPAMLSLTALTAPGPFAVETIKFGHFQGIFKADQLVAMAGQRFQAGAFAEISALCTHPDYRGRGFAQQLMLHQINRISQNNEIPFLHVRCENVNAIRLYHTIGFEVRAEIFLHMLQK